MQLQQSGVPRSHLAGSHDALESRVSASLLGKTYQVRRPVYQPYQERLNLTYHGIAYCTGTAPNASSQAQSRSPSTYVARLVAQLGIRKEAAPRPLSPS